ncbi:MAG: hypothetical protein EOP48_09705 [Sphingobacteriales bacterium]|nr:MAG: hypothetical protein EOP48_09705 [Sphingobacteriales bacterium]
MKEVEVILNSDGKPIPIHHFSEFFTLLRACYILALEETKFEIDDGGDVAIDLSLEQISESILYRAGSLTKSEFNEIAAKTLPAEEEFCIQDIARRNPIDVVFMGIGIALTAALIVSGGKFEFGITKLKIELPPLGEGIAKLKKVFKQK